MKALLQEHLKSYLDAANPSDEVILSRPKTETSVRQVSIPQDAVDLPLQEHSKHPNNQYMFPSPVTGAIYHPDSVVKLHEKILKDAGLEHIRFHDLRHTFATLALQNGVDVKTVSSILGHYDAGFTLCIYTHATRQQQNRVAKRWEILWPGSCNPTAETTKSQTGRRSFLSGTLCPSPDTSPCGSRCGSSRLTHILTHTKFRKTATKLPKSCDFGSFVGAAGRIRTADLILTN